MKFSSRNVFSFIFILEFIGVCFSGCKSHHKPYTKKFNVVHGRYTRDITDFHIIVPQKVHPNGSFHSHHLPHYFNPSVRKKRNLKDERVHYLLHLNGSAHIVDLEPYAHVTSPGMLVETRSKGSDLAGVTFRQPKKHLCHYRGSVRGHPGSRAALSGCDGLVGYIRTKDGTFFVEPLHGESPEEEKEHVHVVYKRSLDHPEGRTCNVRGTEDWWTAWCRRLRTVFDSKPLRKRSEAGASVQRWYEAMIVADKKFLLFHKDHDVEEYILCIMNMVADYYHDASVGSLIDIVIVRIIYLEKEESELDLEISTHGENTLDSFCKWQTKMNPKDPNHPNHHDIAVLFTRYDICSHSDGSCSLLGLANVAAACSETDNCCINEDGGLILGVVTSHELGHTLGCHHDSMDESGCDAVAPDGESTVMNPTVTGRTSAWSTCSRGFISGLFDSQLGECMLDEPKDHTYPLNEMPPGAFYDADEQCSFLFGPDYVHFDQGGDKLCNQLWCKLKDGASTMSLGDPPAEGTKCGPDKWCYNKDCVEMGERPAAINGDWGSWGEWSECSRTCGGGVSSRERQCDNPQPQHRGRYCLGKRHEYLMCNTQECPSGPTFREVQCTEFNSKPYQGVMHTWLTFSAPDSDPNPCALYCINEQHVFTKLAPRVKDGTRCKPGTKDTCIQGSCMVIGCDWKIGSEATEDICGICEGDGTHCIIVEDTITTVSKPGYVPFVMVPAGAMNVHFEEVKSSGNMIAVSATDNKTFYLNGDFTEYLEGEYDFGAGVKGIHEKPEADRSELHIKGPLKEPIVLFGVFFERTNPGMKYKFSIPTDKSMYMPKYHWEYTEWGPCSARCGGGTEVMKSACIEERDGKVKDSYCKDMQKGEPRARTCNDQPCRTRWKVWKWGPCSGCLFQSGTRTRQVECVKENPTSTGDEEIITEPNECCGEMPRKSELCNSPRPCPKNMTSNIVKKRLVQVVPLEKWKEKRESEGGKSFSDMPSSTVHSVKDVVNPAAIHLEEVLIEESHLNLTDQEFQEVGDEIPSKVLSCQVQNLTGQDALNQLHQVIHGPGYNKGTVKPDPDFYLFN